MQIHKNILFENWAKNVRNKVPFLFLPENVEDLKHVLTNHSSIRLVGSGHSWADLWKEAQAIIDLSFLNLSPTINHNTLEVTLSAGMKLWQINQFLDKNGLALQNLGSIDQQSIAGAISTGTHGSGYQFGCLATQCKEVTWIDGHGNIHTFDIQHPHFHAILISLGLLGIIIQLKIQVVPAFHIQENTFTCPWEEAVKNFNHWIHEYDHLKIWWLPPSREVVVYAMYRTQEPIQESRFQHFWRETVLSVWGYRTMVILGNLLPRLRPRINQILTAQMRKPYQRVNKSFKIFKVPEPPKHRETEWAFPLKDASSILSDYFKRYSDNRFTFNFIQEIRVAQADNFWLSPAYHRDTLWLGIYNHYDKQWESLKQDFQSFALSYLARPHWGKEFNLSNKELYSCYPRFSDFMELKSFYDPQNKFGEFYAKK